MHKRWYLAALLLGLAALTVSTVFVLRRSLVRPGTPPGRTASAPIAMASVPPPAEAAATLRVAKDFGRMPLYFIENRGQLDSRVAYYVQGRDTSVYFAKSGITFALTEKKLNKKAKKPGFRKASLPRSQDAGDPSKRWSVKLDFLEANPNVRIAAAERTSAVISYFKGPNEQWRTGLPTYASIIYQDLWPGIDLVYSGTANRLKYSLVVKPGADPHQIRLAYRGATDVRLDGEGRLRVETPVGGFSDDKPYSYQEVAGRRVEVATKYAIEETASSTGREYRFDVGAYDRARTLVLDPAVLVYAGYIGGASDEVGNSDNIAVDAFGNAYVTGRTGSTEATFPVDVGPDLTSNGSTDAFVAKVKADGTGLDYAGYIGGASGDGAYGIAVDATESAYVTGFTTSTEATFPVAVGPDLTFNGGPYDAFVAKVNAAGTGLDYAGYIGGDNFDSSNSVAVDGAGDAYVTGSTISNENTFPVLIGPDLTFNGFTTDAFVAKVNAAGTGLLYAGYVGGATNDVGDGIAVDVAGNAYVAGHTNSTEATFPVSIGPDLTYNGGASDVFVAMVNAAGTGLGYAGYIGGASDESSSGIAVDSAGNAYVTGRTGSDEITFPVAVGPDLTYNGGSYDAFVAKISSVIPPTPTPTPTSTPVPPTATPTDTPTPTQTDTPIPPTNTPTNTPVPTPIADDDEDDDDQDDDGERDDEDEDDDDDGESDADDDDDDNDGLSDGSDKDDDNDGIEDEFDSESSRQVVTRLVATVASGAVIEYRMVADGTTVLVAALVEAAQAQQLTLQIYNPQGSPVGRTFRASGRVLAVASTPSAGTYAIRARNNSSTPITYRATLVQSQKWW